MIIDSFWSFEFLKLIGTPPNGVKDTKCCAFKVLSQADVERLGWWFNLLFLWTMFLLTLLFDDKKEFWCIWSPIGERLIHCFDLLLFPPLLKLKSCLLIIWGDLNSGSIERDPIFFSVVNSLKLLSDSIMIGGKFWGIFLSDNSNLSSFFWVAFILSTWVIFVWSFGSFLLLIVWLFFLWGEGLPSFICLFAFISLFVIFLLRNGEIFCIQLISWFSFENLLYFVILFSGLSFLIAPENFCFGIFPEELLFSSLKFVK